MQALSSQDADKALETLTNAAIQRKQELAKFEKSEETESDSEVESDSPIIDQFTERGGSEAVYKLTNFTLLEFDAIWEAVKPKVDAEWNTGRGRKSSFNGRDVLFMTLTVLKHSGQWHLLASHFKVEASTFERMVMRFIGIISRHLYVEYVERYEQKFTMRELTKNKTVFKYYKYAIYATDVTFQQSNRPSGNHEEAKKYFSNKHKLYGYKVEASVLPNGLCVGCTAHYPGSVADIEILRQNYEFHRRAMAKTESEMKSIDNGAMVDEYSDSWALILDKGYQGAANFLRAVTPKKKPKGGQLSVEEIRRNRKVAHDRIIVENFFGRATVLWAVVGSKYRWDEKSYDNIFALCVALTNIHIKWHPLRDQDGTEFAKYVRRTLSIGKSVIAKRKNTQAAYRARLKERLALSASRVHHEDGAGAMLEILDD